MGAPSKAPKSIPSPRITPQLASSLDIMFRDSPIGYAFLSQPDRKIEYVNETLARMAGITATHAIGRLPDEVFGSALAERLTPQVRAVVHSPEGHGQLDVEVELPSNPGSVRCFRLHCHAIRDESGAHLGTWYAVEEVTKERAIEREALDRQAHLQAIMDLVPIGILTADKVGKLLYANHEAERIWGHPLIEADSPAEYARYGLFSMEGERIEPEETILARVLATCSPQLKSKRLIKRKDGSALTVFSTGVPLTNASGALTGAVVAFYDVTELFRLQARQQRLMEIAQAVNEDADLNSVLRRIRDAVVDTVGFDRAGIWLRDEAAGVLRGTWGTARTGEPIDESAESIPISDDLSAPLNLILAGEIPLHLTTEYGFKSNPYDKEVMSGVAHHATIALRSDDRVIGMLSVDNLLSRRPISESDLQPLLPFCEQAAIAIESARLRQSEREQTAWLRKAVKTTNHRVKNNLQVTLALLDMELQDDDAVIDRKTLKRVRRQIRIIGSVHEFLGDTSPEIDAPLDEVLETVTGVYSDDRAIHCTLSCTPVVVNTKQATAAALILDEVLYASWLRGATTLEVSLSKVRNRVMLSFQDNGPPFPDGFRVDPLTDRNLGLVERLACWDLVGTIAFGAGPDGGGHITVGFDGDASSPS